MPSSLVSESAISVVAKQSFKKQDLGFFSATRRDPVWEYEREAEANFDTAQVTHMTPLLIKLLGCENYIEQLCELESEDANMQDLTKQTLEE